MTYRADARTEAFEHVSMFGFPALLTDARINRSTVPEGWHCYELRGSDYDPEKPIMIENRVVVNHAGTVLMPNDLHLNMFPRERMQMNDQSLNYYGESMTLERFCEEYRLDYPADQRKFIPQPASEDEKYEFYSKPPEIEALRGSIGYLRMDFGRNGKEFWHSWFESGDSDLNTPEFNAEIDDLVNELRHSVLKDRSSMRSFCADNGGDLGENYSIQQYGYKIETENYLYRLRCKPMVGDYDAYLYCFDKHAQEMNNNIQMGGMTTL